MKYLFDRLMLGFPFNISMTVLVVSRDGGIGRARRAKKFAKPSMVASNNVVPNPEREID